MNSLNTEKKQEVIEKKRKKDKFIEDYERLLDKTQITHNDDFNKKIQPLMHLIKDNIPAKLYRFRSINVNNLNAFIYDEVHHAKPIDFKNPFDTLFYINRNKFIRSQLNEFSSLCMSCLNLHISLRNTYFNDKYNETKFKDLKNEVYYRFNNMNAEEQLKNIKNLVNLMYNIMISDDKENSLTDDLKNSTLISCFTEDITSNLMWNQYSDSHKGFALEYTKKPEYIFPIVYTQSRYEITDWLNCYLYKYTLDTLGIAKVPSVRKEIENLNIKMDMLSVVKSNLYKNSEWAYEKEWRSILYPLNNKKNNIILKPSAIYLGCRISQDDENILVRHAKDKDIPIHKMKINYNKQGQKLDSNLI